MKFKNDQAIIKTLDYAIDAGINTFMCTTHDRIANICDIYQGNILKNIAISKYSLYALCA